MRVPELARSFGTQRLGVRLQQEPGCDAAERLRSSADRRHPGAHQRGSCRRYWARPMGRWCRSRRLLAAGPWIPVTNPGEYDCGTRLGGLEDVPRPRPAAPRTGGAHTSVPARTPRVGTSSMRDSARVSAARLLAPAACAEQRLDISLERDIVSCARWPPLDRHALPARIRRAQQRTYASSRGSSRIDCRAASTATLSADTQRQSLVATSRCYCES
jgi:hypothetical protein